MSKAAVEAQLASLPRFPSVADLVAALGSRAAVIDAYTQGWLPANAVDALELTDPARLQCWLLTRLLQRLGGPA